MLLFSNPTQKATSVNVTQDAPGSQTDYSNLKDKTNKNTKGTTNDDAQDEEKRIAQLTELFSATPIRFAISLILFSSFTYFFFFFFFLIIFLFFLLIFLFFHFIFI